MPVLKRVALVIAITVTGLVASAGAATANGLWTDGSVSTLVPSASTASWASGIMTFNAGFPVTCTASTLTTAAASNGATSSPFGVVWLNVTGATFTGCGLPTTADVSPAWQIEIPPLASSNATSCPGEMRDVDVAFSGFPQTGHLVDVDAGGPASSTVEWRNNGAAAASLVLSNAGTLTGTLGSMTVTGTWVAQSGAASWTLTCP